MLKRFKRRNKKIFVLSLFSLFVSLQLILTIFINVPIPFGQGYINLSDCVTFLLAFFVSPLFGGLCGGISGFIADILLGYSVYCVFTLFIKLSMGVLFGCLYALIKKHVKNRILKISFIILSILVSSIWMSFLYFLSDLLLFNLTIGVINIVPNIFQGLISSAVAIYSILNIDSFVETNRVETKLILSRSF